MINNNNNNNNNNNINNTFIFFFSATSSVSNKPIVDVRWVDVDDDTVAFCTCVTNKVIVSCKLHNLFSFSSNFDINVLILFADKSSCDLNSCCASDLNHRSSNNNFGNGAVWSTNDKKLCVVIFNDLLVAYVGHYMANICNVY